MTKKILTHGFRVKWKKRLSAKTFNYTVFFETAEEAEIMSENILKDGYVNYGIEFVKKGVTK